MTGGAPFRVCDQTALKTPGHRPTRLMWIGMVRARVHHPQTRMAPPPPSGDGRSKTPTARAAIGPDRSRRSPPRSVVAARGCSTRRPAAKTSRAPTTRSFRCGPTPWCFEDRDRPRARRPRVPPPFPQGCGRKGGCVSTVFCGSSDPTGAKLACTNIHFPRRAASWKMNARGTPTHEVSQ
jgi:hypothetical protein